VGSDGNVLVRLSRGRQGTGLLALFDAAGMARLNLVGAGVVDVYRPRWHHANLQGWSQLRGGAKRPLVNAVKLGPGGSVSMGSTVAVTAEEAMVRRCSALSCRKMASKS